MSDPDQSAGVTPGSQDLAPEQAEEPIAAVPLLCPICGHAESGHTSDGRCLIMLGEYGTAGPCPCPVQIGAGDGGEAGASGG